MASPVFTRKEKWLVALGSVLIVTLGMLPNLIGWLAQTPEARFNGIYYYWDDVATYMVTIRSGMLGNWRFSLFFTPLPQEGHYVKLFYLALGNLFRGVQISPVTVYYLSLAGLSWLACLVVYRFIAAFFTQPKYRLTAFLLTIFGAGLGWLMILLGRFSGAEIKPTEMWFIDLYPYLSMGLFPHYAAVVIGQLGFVLLFLRYRAEPKVGYPLGMAAVGLALQTIQPYAPMIPFLVVGGILLGSWLLTRRFPTRSVVAVGVVGLVQVPLLVYNYWVFSTDPIWVTFGGQNETLSPPLLDYISGLFWLWLLCLPAIFRPKVFKDTKVVGVLVWILGAMVLAYLPWVMQRRFMLYFTLPLAIIATLGIRESISPWLDRRSPVLASRKPLLLVLLVVVAGFSHVFWLLAFSTSLNAYPPATYHHADVQEGIQWLEEHTWEDSLMVSTSRTGLLAGAYAYQRVYVAHVIETAGYSQRAALVEQFFQNKVPLSALGDQPIDWIFYGPYERELGLNFQPPERYSPVYRQGEVTIYQRVDVP